MKITHTRYLQIGKPKFEILHKQQQRKLLIYQHFQLVEVFQVTQSTLQSQIQHQPLTLSSFMNCLQKEVPLQLLEIKLPFKMPLQPATFEIQPQVTENIQK